MVVVVVVVVVVLVVVGDGAINGFLGSMAGERRTYNETRCSRSSRQPFSPGCTFGNFPKLGLPVWGFLKRTIVYWGLY